MQTYARPNLVFTRGEGVRLYDAHGKEYLDFAAGIAVNALGAGCNCPRYPCVATPSLPASLSTPSVCRAGGLPAEKGDRNHACPAKHRCRSRSFKW